MAFGSQIHYHPISENLSNTLYGSLSNSIIQCTVFYLNDKWIYDNVHTKTKNKIREGEIIMACQTVRIFSCIIIISYADTSLLNFYFWIQRRPWQPWTLIYIECYTCSNVNSWLVWSNFKCVDRPVQILQKLTFK